MLPEKREGDWRQWVIVPTLIFSDLLLTSLLWGLALVLYGIWGPKTLLVGPVIACVLASTVVWMGLRSLLGLYPGYGLGSAEELRRQTYATFATLGVTTIFAFAFSVAPYFSRLLLGIGFLGLLFAPPLVRHIVKWGLARAGMWGKLAVIFGASESGRQLVHTLKEEWGLGLRPVGLFDFGLSSQSGGLEGAFYEGSIANTLHQAQQQGIDTAILAAPELHPDYLVRYIAIARRRLRQVIVVPQMGGVTTSAVTARNLGGVLGVEIKENLLNPWSLRAKRALDFAATIIGGLLILPFLLVISLVLYIDLRGQIFYRAERIGRDGELFSCLKFRTMVDEAESKLQRMLEENAELREEYFRYHKLHDDPRVTAFGRFLRKTSLDELPQLWNVLRGEMSLVGPRPYLPRESKEIGTAQEEILRVPPGITGPWQVAGRSRTSFEKRVQMDVYYVRDWSVWLDLVILARTLESVTFARGAS